jgi:acetolactate synthase-1/2/3 large subunit
MTSFRSTRPPGMHALTETVAPSAADMEDSKLISGGRLLAKALKYQGVDVVFTSCGGEIIDVCKSCIEEGIRIIDARKAQVAALAADGYFRMTGKTGCAVVVVGSGTIAAITGVADALVEESAVLLVGLRSDDQRMGMLGGLPLLRPMTKFAESVSSTGRVADLASAAFRECHNGAPGPAYLEIPVDVLTGSVVAAAAGAPAAGKYRVSRKTSSRPEDIEALAALIVESERPCVLFGSQLWTCQASETAVEFCREVNLPGYPSGAARGTFRYGDPHGFRHTLGHALSRADLIVEFGLPFDFLIGYGDSLPSGADLVQVNLAPNTMGRARDVTVRIVGDSGEVMRDVLRTFGHVEDYGFQVRSPWLEELRGLEQKAIAALAPKLRSDSIPIHPLRLAYELNEFITQNTIFIRASGDVLNFAGDVIEPKAPGQWMDAGPFGFPDVAAPFTIAAKLAHPDKEVLCLFSDGAFSLTSWDFETCIALGMPFIGVVASRSPIDRITHGTQRSEIASKLSSMPYGEIARMLGGYGEEVRDPDQIQSALRQARESGKCALINVWIDPQGLSPGKMPQPTSPVSQ